jgi:hypothetical protein
MNLRSMPYRIEIQGDPEGTLECRIKYTYKRQGIITSENEITRIATNYFIEDYRNNGEESLLAIILKRLNS